MRRCVQASTFWLLVLLMLAANHIVRVSTQANVKHSGSYNLLVSPSEDSDYQDDRKPAARRLLEQMSLPRYVVLLTVALLGPCG